MQSRGTLIDLPFFYTIRNEVKHGVAYVTIGGVNQYECWSSRELSLLPTRPPHLVGRRYSTKVVAEYSVYIKEVQICRTCLQQMHKKHV